MIDFQCLADRMQGQMRAGLAIKILIFALLVLSLGSSLAGPLQNPKRVVNGQTVDLNPLFQWWSKHNGYRPLAAWVHITGSIAGTNGVGWIVAGKIEKSPVHATDGTHESSGEEEKAILSHPPVADLVEFERLSADLKVLNAQRSQISGQEKEAANGLKSLHSSHVRSRVRAAEQRQLQQTENVDKNELKLLDLKIQEIKKQLASSGSSERYAVDCFALDTGRKFAGMAVYDHGQAFK